LKLSEQKLTEIKCQKKINMSFTQDSVEQLSEMRALKTSQDSILEHIYI